MLRKLLKWELKATARLFIPLYLTLLLFAFINRIINPFNLIETSNNFSIQIVISYLSIIAYFTLIVGVVAMTLVIMIQRFYKSLLGDEGYLMFTLPIATWKHILSKLLVASLWVITSILSTLFSILIVARTEHTLYELVELLNIVKDFIGLPTLLFIPVIMTLMVFTGILMVYGAISLGHMFSKHKLIASFAMYGVLYLFNQILIIIAIVIFANSFLVQLVNDPEPTPSVIRSLILLYGLFATLLSACYFTLSNKLLTKKLNLE